MRQIVRVPGSILPQRLSPKMDFHFHRLGMSLAKQKESLIRARDRLAAEVGELNKRIQQQTQQIEAYEAKRLEYEEKCRELYKSLDVMNVALQVTNKNLCQNILTCVVDRRKPQRTHSKRNARWISYGSRSTKWPTRRMR